MALDDVTRAAIGAAIEGGFTDNRALTLDAVVEALNGVADEINGLVSDDFLTGVRFSATFVQDLRSRL